MCLHPYHVKENLCLLIILRKYARLHLLFAKNICQFVSPLKKKNRKGHKNKILNRIYLGYSWIPKGKILISIVKYGILK